MGGGTTIFRGEKNTNWEGGYRVPTAIKWPGVIKPGQIINEIGAHEDMLPTILAAAGNTTIKEDLKKGDVKAINREYKVHLDGYNLKPYFEGKAEWPRDEFYYWTDGGDMAGIRYKNWKIVFMEQRAHGADVWQEPFVTLRMPKLFNLKMDPFEAADHNSIFYDKWKFDRLFALVPAQVKAIEFLNTFKEYPPMQEVADFGLKNVMKQIENANKRH